MKELTYKETEIGGAFVDEETGNRYLPKNGFRVTAENGGDLHDSFNLHDFPDRGGNGSLPELSQEELSEMTGEQFLELWKKYIPKCNTCARLRVLAWQNAKAHKCIRCGLTARLIDVTVNRRPEYKSKGRLDFAMKFECDYCKKESSSGHLIVVKDWKCDHEGS